VCSGGKLYVTLHQLKVFVAVGKYLNITRTADALHISQPSVSQQLKLLEEDCRLKLYRRSGRRIELTEEGKLFLNRARAIVVEVEGLRKGVESRPDHIGGESLTIGGGGSPSASILPLVVAMLKRTHPKVQVIFYTGTSLAIEEMVLNYKVDVGWVSNPSHSPMIAYEPFRRQKLVVLAPAKHPLAKRSKLTLDQLVRVPFIIVQQMAGRANRTTMFLRQLKNQGLAPNIVIECELFTGVPSAVKAGIGLGIIYQDVAEPDVVDRDLKVLDIPELKIEFDSFIIYHKERPLSPVAQDYVALLRKWPGKARLGNPSLPLI
jgi:DNA-binding transcriptional LysR family regulator